MQFLLQTRQSLSSTGIEAPLFSYIVDSAIQCLNNQGQISKLHSRIGHLHKIMPSCWWPILLQTSKLALKNIFVSFRKSWFSLIQNFLCLTCLHFNLNDCFCFAFCALMVWAFYCFGFLLEDNSNAPERMASVQGTPEQIQKVTDMIQEIIQQVTMISTVCLHVYYDEKLLACWYSDLAFWQGVLVYDFQTLWKRWSTWLGMFNGTFHSGQEKTQVWLPWASEFDLGQVKIKVWWPSGQVKLTSKFIWKCQISRQKLINNWKDEWDSYLKACMNLKSTIACYSSNLHNY